jgi:hypothetical protein
MPKLLASLPGKDMFWAGIGQKAEGCAQRFSSYILYKIKTRFVYAGKGICFILFPD